MKNFQLFFFFFDKEATSLILVFSMNESILLINGNNKILIKKNNKSDFKEMDITPSVRNSFFPQTKKAITKLIKYKIGISFILYFMFETIVIK